jgi:PAS domain S-box-containing protein
MAGTPGRQELMIVDPFVAGLTILSALSAFVLGGLLVWLMLATGHLPKLSADGPAAGGTNPMASASALQTLIDAIPAMINCKDREGRYVLMNEHQATLFGTTPRDAVGRTAADFLGAQFGDHAGALDRQAIETGSRVGPTEEEFADAHGQLRPWLTSKSPIENSDGVVTHIVTVAFDISEHKRIERMLIEARNEAEAASRAKAAFLATMSHELRTPLNAIIGFGDLIHRGVLGPIAPGKYCEYARDIAESGRFLLAIINDILDLSKIEAGQVTLEAETVDPADLLQRCRRFVELRARQEEVEIAVRAADGLPAIHADPRMLTQVVTNLLTNAVKFSGRRGVVALSAAVAGDGCLELCVEDHGIGMDEEEIQAALRPFEQVDREHARKHEGTGLGLPIVKGLVALHGGELAIKSARGIGTTAIVRLPPHRMQARASADEAAALITA